MNELEVDDWGFGDWPPTNVTDGDILEYDNYSNGDYQTVKGGPILNSLNVDTISSAVSFKTSSNVGLQKVGDALLKYGLPFLVTLGKIGWIKNKNLPLTPSNVNTDITDALVTGKSNGTDYIQPTSSAPAPTTILGIPMQTIIVGLSIFLGWILFFKEDKKTKSK